MTRDRLTNAGAIIHWPRALFAEDIALAFNIPVAAARRRLAAGDLGPTFCIGRKRGVLREVLHDTLLRASGIAPALALPAHAAGEVRT